MEIVSLRTLIYDIFNIARGAQRTDDDPLTTKQVEAWIHHYRSMLIKQDIDKGKDPSTLYIQEISAIELEPVKVTGDDNSIVTDTMVYRTSVEIPKTIDFNHKSGLVYIGDVYGNTIQLVPENRVNLQKYKRYSNDIPIAYRKNNRIYVYNSKELQYISIRGIFEVPSDLILLNNPATDSKVFTYDDPYPIPMSMVPVIKDMILKNELRIELSTLSDETNNSKLDLNNK
jgi:hypothetical protein